MTGTLIKPDTLAELITDGHTVTIDTRSPEEYAAGHIPGAVNIREIFTYLATSDPAGLVRHTVPVRSATPSLPSGSR